MRNCLYLVIAAAAIMLVLACGGLHAEVPSIINFQGRLTDASGASLDGSYQVKFKIYGTATGSDSLWSSGFQSVDVADGLFTYALGSGIKLPDDLFAIYGTLFLGITVGADAEISPRTALYSVPMALHAMRTDSAGYATEARRADTADYALAGEFSGDYVERTGDTLRGTLYFERSGAGTPEGRLLLGGTPSNQYMDIELRDTDSLTTRLWGQDFGELNLHYGATGLKMVDIAANHDGGAVRLSNGTVDVINLVASSTGDASVVLPDGAISSEEILNEVGVAQATNTTDTVSGTTMQDIVVDSITVPAPGYVFCIGRANVGRLVDTMEINEGTYQIDATAGGSAVSGRYTRVTLSEGFDEVVPFTTNMLYTVDAGTHVYRLEGRTNASSAWQTVSSARLTLIYIPTSYAAVKEVLPDPGDAPATAVTDPSNPDGGPAYEVDLRHYELKAREARIRALEAERELREAQERADRDRETSRTMR